MNVHLQVDRLPPLPPAQRAPGPEDTECMRRPPHGDQQEECTGGHWDVLTPLPPLPPTDGRPLLVADVLTLDLLGRRGILSIEVDTAYIRE